MRALLILLLACLTSAQAFAQGDRNATVLITIVAGPLNYFGVNPKVHCEVPQPSK